MSSLSNQLKIHELLGLSPKFPLFRIKRNNHGEYAAPLQGFISACCGVNLIGGPTILDRCAACNKEMNDDTVLAVYDKEQWEELSSKFDEIIFIQKTLNDKNEIKQ